jgi:hypothetical protein
MAVGNQVKNCYQVSVSPGPRVPANKTTTGNAGPGSTVNTGPTAVGTGILQPGPGLVLHNRAYGDQWCLKECVVGVDCGSTQGQAPGQGTNIVLSRDCSKNVVFKLQGNGMLFDQVRQCKS